MKKLIITKMNKNNHQNRSIFDLFIENKIVDSNE